MNDILAGLKRIFIYLLKKMFNRVFAHWRFDTFFLAHCVPKS